MILFMDKNDISKEIESYVEKNGGSYIDSVLFFCEKYTVDPEYMKKYITKPIKEKLEIEGRELNILRKKETKLPLFDWCLFVLVV